MNYHLAMMGMPFRCRQVLFFYLFDDLMAKSWGLRGQEITATRLVKAFGDRGPCVFFSVWYVFFAHNLHTSTRLLVLHTVPIPALA